VRLPGATYASNSGPCSDIQSATSLHANKEFLDGTQEQHEILLACIDAPERGQPFGKRSKQRMSELVAGRDARVDWYKKDRWGRLIGQVWVASPDSESTHENTLQFCRNFQGIYSRYGKSDIVLCGARCRTQGYGTSGAARATASLTSLAPIGSKSPSRRALAALTASSSPQTQVA
jgi:hypothetical protein